MYSVYSTVYWAICSVFLVKMCCKHASLNFQHFIYIYHLQTVTFQLVVATDGIYSLVMFLYDQEIEIRSETVIGFAAGNMSTFYQMPVNQTQNVQSGSNAGQAGLWMFRTDGGVYTGSRNGRYIYIHICDHFASLMCEACGCIQQHTYSVYT